jgi:hypothetical protein
MVIPGLELWFQGQPLNRGLNFTPKTIDRARNKHLVSGHISQWMVEKIKEHQASPGILNDSSKMKCFTNQWLQSVASTK